MQNLIAVIACLLFCSFLPAQTIGMSNESSDMEPKYPNFQGDWQCILSERDISCEPTEALGDTEPRAAVDHVMIRGNKIMFFEYPCCFKGFDMLIGLGFDTIWYGSFDAEITMTYLTMRNDTLFSVDNSMSPVTSIYVRDTLDQQVIVKLMRGDINPECVQGKWYLVREEWFGYGSYINYDYPYKLRDSIFIDSANVKSLSADRKYVIIPVGGKLRKCTARYHYDYATENFNLELQLADKKDAMPFIYRRKE